MLIVSIGSIWIATARAMPTSRYGGAICPSPQSSPRKRGEGASIQFRPQLLQQCRGLMPRHAIRSAQDDLLESGGGRAHVAEPGVQQSRLAPQLGEVGSQHQHGLDHGNRPLVALRLNEARLQIVLKAQQHVAIRYRSIVLGLKFASRTRGRLQQLAQLGRGADPAVMERVEDQPLGTLRQADKEMAWEGEPDGL